LIENKLLLPVIAQLHQLQQRPAPFTPGEPLFWDDPHISSQLLAVHLDPETEAASRHPETIARSVDWLIEVLALQPGAAVLDLGCGPGLYAVQLANQGMNVTGVDYSRRSIDYAIESARTQGLAITYRYQDYLSLEDKNQYAAALLIYGDFCVLPPAERAQLLTNIHRALKPDGYLALDVSTREHRKRHGVQNGWYAAESGFWKPGPHLVLEQGFDYPDAAIYLDQYAVLVPDGTLTVYRNWFQDYTPETITAELQQGGFDVTSVWGDLAGDHYMPTSEWIGVIARPR